MITVGFVMVLYSIFDFTGHHSLPLVVVVGGSCCSVGDHD
jgi:hypothetical protein